MKRIETWMLCGVFGGGEEEENKPLKRLFRWREEYRDVDAVWNSWWWRRREKTNHFRNY